MASHPKQKFFFISISARIVSGRGSFTLIELLVSIGVIAILVVGVSVSLNGYKKQTEYNLGISEIVSVLRGAQSRAVAQDRGQGWGVQFINATTGGQAALFWGNAYVTSSVIFRQTLPAALALTDPAPGFSKTIIFAPITGAPGGADVVVARSANTGAVTTITVSRMGLVSAINESGLVGYWPMDEGAGSSVYDASGNNNVGALTIGAGGTQTTTNQAWANGSPAMVSGGINFDGTDDYANFGNSSVLGMSDNITVIFWIRAPVNSSYQRAISKNSQTSQGWEIQNSPNTANVAIRIDTTSSTNQLFYINGIINSVWHQVGFVISGGSVARYVDGSLQNTNSYAVGNGLSNTNNFVVGASAVLGGYFNETIDDVRIYNRALSATEIKNLYSAY